jgi:succinate-semialdehyde dehydrogenase / glutarate-semialdehyde dehydrogenase
MFASRPDTALHDPVAAGRETSIQMAIASINPANGQVLQTFQPIPDSEVETKLQRATAAFAAYRRTSFAERAKMMARAADILDRQKDELAGLMTLEMGKTLRSAAEEALKCAWGCRYYAEHAEAFLADQVAETPAQRSFIRYQPVGAILAIMPWNFPFWQVFRFAAPALMAGNVALLKHAPNVPQCALKIEEIFLEAGFPEGVFQTLLIEAEKVDALLGDPRIAAATLTGSELAGSSVGAGAAKRIKKVVLELGGNDPFIVMPSANLDEAVATGVKARTQNNGQSCIAAKRFIVAEQIADKFAAQFVRGMEQLKVGDPVDAQTDVGPLCTPRALASLEEQVHKTVAAGARVLTGGKRITGAGNFFPPTVLTDIPKDSPAYRDELFGPVASVFRVPDIAAAIRLANDSRYGLGASVWTNSAEEQERFMNELEVGMVFFNQMVASDPRVPFGGVKRSGYGRELSVYGIREFTNVKTIWIR